VGKGASVRARGRVWPRRRLDVDAIRSPSRSRRDDASETRFTARNAALGNVDFRVVSGVGDWTFCRCETCGLFSQPFSGNRRSPSRCASALRRRHSCRHCPSAHAAVAPGSPRVHRARWARKPKENTAWVRVPCPRRRTAPRPSRHPPFPRNRRRRRRLSGDDAPTTRATTSEQPERRVRYKPRPRSRDIASRRRPRARLGDCLSRPRRERVTMSAPRRPSRRRRSPPPLFPSSQIRRQVLLPGEGAGLPLARVVQARAAEPQV
jgi:hypothetical protein